MSRTRRSQPSYAKLLKRVDPRSRTPFAWEGHYLQPGATIAESAMWPDGTFPRTPLIMEFAGADDPAKGWNRHKCPSTVILWAYERSSGKFIELGRVSAPGGAWAPLLEPLVMAAMQREQGDLAPVDTDLVRLRIIRFLANELNLVKDADRAEILTLVHDELASRIAEWSEPLFVGFSGSARSPRVF